jgi:hypothetical protein
LIGTLLELSLACTRGNTGRGSLAPYMIYVILTPIPPPSSTIGEMLRQAASRPALRDRSCRFFESPTSDIPAARALLPPPHHLPKWRLAGIHGCMYMYKCALLPQCVTALVAFHSVPPPRSHHAPSSCASCIPSRHGLSAPALPRASASASASFAPSVPAACVSGYLSLLRPLRLPRLQFVSFGSCGRYSPRFTLFCGEYDMPLRVSTWPE